MDCDLLRSGPLTQELTDRFSMDLTKSGYDPSPSNRWITRLGRAGFIEVKRTWTVVPMAATLAKPKQPKRDLSEPMDDLERAKEEMQRELEAWTELGVVKGCTDDVASVTGLVGGWKWEEWMVKLDSEKATPDGKKGLVLGIGAALAEAREKGSGWRCLIGWARKPTKTRESVKAVVS